MGASELHCDLIDLGLVGSEMLVNRAADADKSIKLRITQNRIDYVRHDDESCCAFGLLTGVLYDSLWPWSEWIICSTTASLDWTE
jgi:hypothetical protein